MAAARTRRPAAAPAPTLAPAAPSPPAFGAYRLEQLGTGRCKFACTTVGTDHRFCGRPTVACETNGNRYGSRCADHLPVVFEAWQPGGRVLRRAGRA